MVHRYISSYVMYRNVQPLPMCSLWVQALNASVSLIVICIIFCSPPYFVSTHTQRIPQKQKWRRVLMNIAYDLR